METYKKNLLNHLNDNGLIVCADVVMDDRSRLEASVFDDDMEIRGIDEYPYGIEHRNPGHVYVRR